jgi:hypothetical protein
MKARRPTNGGFVGEHKAQVGVECPQCHFRQFVEVAVEQESLFDGSPLYREIQEQLVAWMRSRCPDHLGVIADMSKN